MAVGLYDHGSRKPCGHRLATPRDPVVLDALGRTCPTCHVDPDVWCVGVAEGKTNGRRRTRLHFTRCRFATFDAMGNRVGVQ